MLLANDVDPDQMQHNVASDLGLHCLPMTLLGFPGKNRLMYSICNFIYIFFLL